MALAVGIDVGGTKIAGGVVDEDGHDPARRAGSRRRPTPTRSSARSRTWSPSCAAEPRRSRRSASARRASSTRARSTVLFAPNLAWRDEPLQAPTSRSAIELPVVVENDANAAAWGEFTFGAGEDVEDLLLVTVGTGVGGGIVLDGELYRGAFGVGGRDRAHARGARTADPVRLRQPRLLGAVRQRHARWCATPASRPGRAR